jgi:hypothetical protein
MPFKCELRLNNGAKNENETILFTRFIDKFWGTYNKESVIFGKALVDNMKYHLITTSPSYLSERGNLIINDEVNSETILGYFNADGEDIPYDKPYANLIKADKNNLMSMDIVEYITNNYPKEISHSIISWIENLSWFFDDIISEKESNRIIRATLFLSKDDYIILKKNIHQATQDYRNILYAAEYDIYDKRIRDFTKQF